MHTVPTLVRRAFRLWPALLCALAGCSYVGATLNGAAIVVGLIRSPIVMPSAPPDDPLPSAEREGLERLASTVLYQSTRYPLATRSVGLTPTLDPLLYSKPRNSVVTPRDAFDDLCDLRCERRRQATVFAAFSGGGTRAAVLAAQTMALLEKRYNELVPPDAPPFAHAVDAYSSVSGGSLYTYHLALETIRKRAELAYEQARSGALVEPDSDDCPTAQARDREANDADSQMVGRTADLDVAQRYASSLSEMGYQSAALYFNVVRPYTFFYGPLSTLFTDNSYLQFMATSLQDRTASDLWAKDLTRPSGVRRVFGPLDQSQVTLGMIGDRPRFFFNATSLETGGPFVLTQRMMHLPSDSYETLSARYELTPTGEAKFDRPLRHATTIEEINASPSRFPLASAAMASAAFPIGMDPLTLRRYGYSRADGTVYETNQEFRLVDGGVWDNSGLIALTDLTRHIAARDRYTCRPDTEFKHRLRLVLISVNAETETYDSTRLLREKGGQRGFWNWLSDAAPVFPLRLANIYPSLDLIHYTNKRRAEQLAVQSVTDTAKALARLRTQSKVFPSQSESSSREDVNNRLFYFPINLTQLSTADPNHIDGYEDLFEKVQNIGTNYTIDRDAPRNLAAAAAAIVTTPQGRCKGWFVGPACDHDHPQEMTEVQRLDDAVAIALYRTNAEKWPGHFAECHGLQGGDECDPLRYVPQFSTWCPAEPNDPDRPRTHEECKDALRRLQAGKD